jgi:hypothetical protein
MCHYNPDAASAWAREQRAAREAEAERHRIVASMSRFQPARWARTMQGVGEWMENTGRRLQARYDTIERKEKLHAAATRTQPV